MEVINDSITNALLQLFKNRHFIPLHPFKILVQSLLRDEASEGVSHQVIDYASIPTEEMHLQIKMVLFGDSTFVGTKHLVKLISASSVRELKLTAEIMRSVFGNQISHTKTDRIEAHFIEVFHVNSGLSFSLAKPRQHRVEMFVEVIIKGKIDECINLFIRRILEDAYTTEASSNILTASLSVSIRGTIEEINVYSMRDKRQQVVNSLKAAVLDEGDISLECFVHTSRNLLSYGDSVIKSVESTEGFTRVKRWYKLSYRDESDAANPVVRCFARNPLESVAMGIFTSLKDADMYVRMLSEHLQRMKPRMVLAGKNKEKADAATSAGENATFMLNDLINSLCGAVVAHLEDGELSDAGESMLLMLGLMTCQRPTLTHAMQQVKRITHSNTVHICAVRDALHTLKESLVLLINLVQHSPAVLNQLRGNALSEVEVAQINKITSIYSAFSPAVKQIRVLLLELVGCNAYSELQYLAPHMMNLLWRLFDPVTKAVPLLSPDLVNLKDKGIASAVGVMKFCEKILHRLSSLLHMVELTVGTEVFISTIKQDLLSYKSFTRNASLGLSSLIGRGNSSSANASTASGFTADDSCPISHTYLELPKCLSDLIGYAIERHSYASTHPKRISIGDYSDLVWRPASISHLLKLQLVPEDRKSKSAFHIRGGSSSSGDGPGAGGGSGVGAGAGAKKKGGDTDSANANTADRDRDRERMERNVEEGVEQLQHLWDFYALLGEYNVPRLGGVDFKSLVQEEWDRYDVPRFMCIEGAKLRFLTDIHVLRAFHEGIFEITTGPTQRAFFPVLCRHLFKFPTFVALWNNVDHGIIQDFVLQPARRDWVIHEKSAAPGSGLHVVKLRNVPESLKLFISGGVLGSDRVLSALGAHVEKVFLNMWHLPPLFASPPASRSGMQIKIFCGVSVTTASHWCAPQLHRLRPIQVARQARRTAREVTSNFIDQELISPTAQQVEKKRIFANFLGGRSANHERTERASKISRRAQDSLAGADELQFSDVLDDDCSNNNNNYYYYLSDDEDGPAETAQNDIHRTVYAHDRHQANVGPASSNAGVGPKSRYDAGREGCDLDSGVLRSRGEMELEVVMRVSYETAAILSQVQAAFGKEVSNCCRYMQETTDWKLGRLVVHRDGEKTADFGTKSETRSSIFSSADLGDANGNTHMWQSLEEIVAKYGTATLEAGALYPEADSTLSQAELMEVFQKLIHRSTPAGAATSGHSSVQNVSNYLSSTSERVASASASANQFYSADFKNIKDTSMHSSTSNNGINNGMSRVDSARDAGFSPPSSPFENNRATSGSKSNINKNSSENEFRSPRPANYNTHPYTIDEEVADEQNQLLDPTYSDADRICRDSYVRKLLLQKLQDRQRLPRNHRARGSATSHPAPASWSSSLPPPNGGGSSVAAEELQPVFCYIPIRIRFTLLAQLNPRMSWGVSALKTPTRGNNTNSRAGAGASGAPGEHYSAIIGHQANPLTVGSDHAIARLVSSTLWLSPEAARTVWLCAKDGAAQCCYHEAHQRHKAYHRCMAQGQICQAYEHVLVNGLLTQNYRLVTSVNRAYNGISFKFKRLIDCVELCRGVLLSDNTTYDINALGMTIARYIVLGFRYLLMSPQVAHLRGGCAYLLTCVKRVETLLQLAPIEIRCATSCLPTRLGAVSSEELPSVPGKTKVEDKRTPGPKITVSGSGGAGAEGGDQGGLRMKFKADDVDFEAGLSFGVNKGQQQTSGSGNSRSGNNISNNSSSSAPYEARRVPVFDAPPPLSEAALLAPPPGAPFGGGAGGSAGGGSSIGGATKLGNEGEVMFRRVLAQPARIQEVVALLHELEGMSRALLLTLCEDMCANFPDISAAMCLKTAAAVAKESIPAAVVSLGVDAKLAGSGRSAEFAIPPMVSSLDSLEYVLGKDCSIESLVAYIHRAETPVNSALSDPDFALHIQSAHSLRQFKIAKSTALSVDSERLVNLRKVVEISRDFTREEQEAVKEIVFSAALPPVKKPAMDTSTKGAGAGGAQQEAQMAAVAGVAGVAAAGVDDAATALKVPGRVHRSASVQFRAGADVIRLLIEGANLRKQDAASAGDRPLLSSESGADLPSADGGAEDDIDSATAGERALKSLKLTSGTTAAAAPTVSNLRKLHTVNSAVMALSKGSKGNKGISSLLKKMNLQVDATAATSIDGENGADAGGVSITASTGAAKENSKIGGISDIHNLVDAIFRKRAESEDAATKSDDTTSELSLSLAPSFASLPTISSFGDEFHRPPVSFSLSRFHDDAITQRRNKAEQDAARALGLINSPLRLDSTDSAVTVTSGDAAGELSDEGGEDIMLSSMRPSGDYSSAPVAVVPPAVRVFAHVQAQAEAQRYSGESQSMLQLLRAAMADSDCAASSSSAAAAPAATGPGAFASPAAGFFSSPCRLRPAPPSEPLIEQTGMLQRLRHVPKPDHQAQRVVYF